MSRKMTREQCEERLLKLAEQAVAVLHRYDPDAKMFYLYEDDGHISISALKGDTEVGNLQGSKDNTHALYVTKFRDGDVWGTAKWVEVESDARECAS